MRLIFIRHGDPDYVKDCLTEKGQLQAKAAAERLMKEGIEEIYSSPQGRAWQTAEAFSKTSGIEKIQVLDFMKEIRFGPEEDLYNEYWSPWKGADRLVSEGQDLQNPLWKDFPLFKNNTARIDVDFIQAQADLWLESLGYKREGLYYRNLRADDSQHTIALFSHGGSSTAFLSRIFNLSFPFLCASMHIPHTGITVIRFDRTPGKLSIPVVELMNDGNHITPILPS